MATALCLPEPAVGADPMLPRPFRVGQVRRETHDTWTLALSPAGGDESFAFAPGQFNMLYAFGVGEVPISISGDPARPLPVVHTLRSVGAATRALARARSGDLLGLRGPFGKGWPLAEAAGRDLVVLAGGIGLAPLRPAVYQLLARRERYGRIVVLYGARSPRDLLYRQEIQRWRSRFDLMVEPTVDFAAAGWRGHVGVVTRLIARGGFEPGNTLALLCGPEIMMRYAVRELLRQGVAAERIHLSLERNMKCAVGFCGHCQLGPHFLCKDGPVFALPRVASIFELREV
jgi:NAD(P)H-flavin reductase